MMKNLSRSKLALTLFACTLAVAAFAIPFSISAHNFQPAHAASATMQFPTRGGLDCNNDSAIQKDIKPDLACIDFGGYDGGRGYDNGHYVGHDEPTMSFFSNSPGSGSNMQWQVKLPTERALPATQTFENYITFWFGMVLCDPNGYPQTPCTPASDSNHAPRFLGDTNTSGSAFLELQFYPPGFYPFISRISCDRTHWCAALNIDSLECTPNFVTCNPNCTEPVNFAFIQTNGVPPGPPGPTDQTNATFTPNAHTLLMNQGDTLRVTLKDTPNGLLTKVDDLTTGATGFMVASGKNGFQSLNVNTCAPTPYNFRPEYSTAKFGNFLNWGAGQNNIGFDVEIGHFTPGVHGDGDKDDPPCFKGPTLPGCLDFRTGGDLDFDGTSYLPDWPDGTRNTPTSIQISSILGNGVGPVSEAPGDDEYSHPYPSMYFDTEVGASESTCTSSGAGCTVPPPGAVFYPFYAQAGHGASCVFTVGNDIRGMTTNDFGRDAEYGHPNLQWYFGDSSSGVFPNPCIPHAG
jgi:hypothetical protein